MERSSPGIFGAIQIHAGDSPRPNDPPVHEEETRWRLQRVCYQMEECGINGPTTPHQSRRKFHVCGHSTLPVLWHANCQYFCGVWRINVFRGENRRWNKERKNCRHWGKQGGEGKICFWWACSSNVWGEKKITYGTGRVCQESPLLIRVYPSPLCRSSVTPKVRIRIRLRVWPRLLPKQKKEKDLSVRPTSNVLYRVAPYTDSELWDFCHSCKAQKTSISKEVRCLC